MVSSTLEKAIDELNLDLARTEVDKALIRGYIMGKHKARVQMLCMLGFIGSIGAIITIHVLFGEFLWTH